MQVQPCPKCGKNDWELTSKKTWYRCKNCNKLIPTNTAPTAEFHKGVEDEKKPQLESKTSTAITIILHIILSLAAPVAAVLILWPLLSAQGIYIYAAIILVLGTLVMYVTVSKHGIAFGVFATIIFFIIYVILIGIIDIFVTGNIQPIYNIVAPFVPESYRDSLMAYLQSSKCIFTLNPATCNSGTNGNLPKTNKPIEDYKFIDIKFGEEATEYKLINQVRVGQIFPAQITIESYAEHDVNNIVVSGELKNETGDTIKMSVLNCATPDENCQVGPNKPPLVITLKSSKPIDFIANSFVYLNIYVSYPFTASGSNDFPIVMYSSAIKGLDTSQAKTLTPGLGPLDTIVHFSTSYYVIGTAKVNPEAANITVYSDIVNGKKKNYGENGYGKIAAIKVSYLSDIQIPSSSITCVTPDGDSFNEGEVHEVGGLKVTDTQGYTCNFLVPDNIVLNAPSKSVKFITTISYNYTDVKKTDGLPVCPSDQSKPCAQ